MTHSAMPPATLAAAPARRLPLVLSLALGLLVVGFAGLSQVEAVHDAAHDYRHSLGFPCH